MVKPLSATKIDFFLLKKRKRCRMFWNENIFKNIWWTFCVLVKTLRIFHDIFFEYWYFSKYFSLRTKVLTFLSKTYVWTRALKMTDWLTDVLDFSGSYDMHIKKCKQKYYFFLKAHKKTIFAVRGKGAKNVADWFATATVFFQLRRFMQSS